MTLAPDSDVSHASALARSAPGRRARPWHGAGRALASRWDILAVISAGGALGSLARWGVAVALPHPPGAFPWSTFAANLSGALVIGALMVMITDVWPPSRHARPFLGVGVLGGYTTFSTYMLDTRELLMTGHVGMAGLYLAGTLSGGLAAVWTGTALARLAVRTARRRSLRAAGSDEQAADSEKQATAADSEGRAAAADSRMPLPDPDPDPGTPRPSGQGAPER